MIVHHNSQDTRNTTPTAPQLHTLQNNHPLSLVPQNYRKISLTEHISTIHRYPQSPVTRIVAQQPNVDETYVQIIEQNHILLISGLRTTIFLAHDEPPDWIPQPFPFIPIQPPTSLPSLTNFCIPSLP